jgi:hypothetical protein
MMKVYIPDNFIPERTYAINVILKEFLGFEFHIIIHKKKDYQIIGENGNTLTIRDHFFSNFDETGFLYDENKFPSVISYFKNGFIGEKDIPVIYGNPELEVDEKSIICGIDIFASSFFMLTRWEEYANKKKDDHGRFSGLESIAYKNGFLNRPVVNEYTKLLSNMLLHLNICPEPEQKKFISIPTHDIDQPLWSDRSIIKRTLKDISSKKDPGFLIDNIQTHIKSKINYKHDPYNTYDYLMNISEQNGLKSFFFFSSSRKSKFDIGYDINSNFIKSSIKRINDRGHFIGFHPGYYSYNDEKIWKNEYQQLSSAADFNSGRQHYLRFEVPSTWQIWENNGMEWDSTMTYHDKEGFRCGSCYEFSVFNILTRKNLNLKERPLIVMEGSFFQYQSLTYQEIIQKILDLKKIVKKYDGNFVFLWHNSSFNVPGYENNKIIYEEIIK